MYVVTLCFVMRPNLARDFMHAMPCDLLLETLTKTTCLSFSAPTYLSFFFTS